VKTIEDLGRAKRNLPHQDNYLPAMASVA
jgi:hypothetical protein